MRRLSLGVALLLLALLAPGAVARAQEPQSSASAFDLAAAVAAAGPEETITVPPGVYAGPLRIDKPITLVGEGMPVIRGTGKGDVVHIEAPNVTLRGFAIQGSGRSLDREDAGVRVNAAGAVIEGNDISDALFGIYFAQAPDGIIRDNRIVGMDLPESRRGDGLKIWYSANTLVEGNHLQYTRDAVIWYSPGTTVRNNRMEHGRYGIHFMSSDDHVVENNVLRGNSVGIYLMYGSGFVLRNNLLADNRGPSGYGLGLKETNEATVEGNRLVNNRVGVYSDASPLRPNATIDFRSNLVAYNEIGLLLLPNVQRNVFTGNVFLENAEQVSISGGGELRAGEWSEAGVGNFWSDYRGYDANGDQVGELPYKATSLYESLTAEHPELRLFQGSPAADALDLAARAFPIFQPRPILTDPHPLTAAPVLPPVPGMAEPQAGLNLALAIAMVAVAIIVMGAGMRRWA